MGIRLPRTDAQTTSIQRVFRENGNRGERVYSDFTRISMDVSESWECQRDTLEIGLRKVVKCSAERRPHGRPSLATASRGAVCLQHPRSTSHLYGRQTFESKPSKTVERHWSDTYAFSCQGERDRIHVWLWFAQKSSKPRTSLTYWTISFTCREPARESG